MSVSSGWLVDQLPRQLGEDDFTRGFVMIFEDIAGSIRSRVTGFHSYLDPGLAPTEFTRWLGGWLDLGVGTRLSEERLRAVVRAAGPLYAWRGTRRGLTGLLEAVTGGRVKVADGGGVAAAGRGSANNDRVIVTLTSPGQLSEDELLALIALEVPPTALVELHLTNSDQSANDKPGTPRINREPHESDEDRP